MTQIQNTRSADKKNAAWTKPSVTATTPVRSTRGGAIGPRSIEDIFYSLS